MVCIPPLCKASSAFGPTPQMARTGKGARKRASCPRGTNTSPSGFSMSDAIFATVLLVPAPIDTVSPRLSVHSLLKVPRQRPGPP